MIMFGLFSKKQSALLAACDGVASDLQTIPDEAFSSGMLGQGYAIEPTNGFFYSPVAGRVESIAPSKHAYSIRSENGLDVLVHIGVDTVSLNGEGFESLVQEGYSVLAGTPIAKANLNLLRQKDLPTVTAVLIADPEKLENIEYKYGKVSGAKDTVMRFRIGKKG